MMGSAIVGRCPACGQGKVFDGVYAVRQRCDHCGVVFLREEGNWIGASVLAYMLGSAFAVGLLLVMWATGALFEKGAEWIVAGSTVAFLLVTFRLVKGFWVGLLYEWGYVTTDEDAPPEHAPPRR